MGEGAPLSAAALLRLKGAWQADSERWRRADLSELELVDWWADGLSVQAGIADRKAALGEIQPAGDEQRCWTHKLLKVRDALPEKEQAEARERLRALMYAQSRSACARKRDEFLLRFKKTAPQACATLSRDWERLVTCFDYPREHGFHLRTTNVVESPFDPVRLRTNASRRFKKTENAEAMIWKLLRVAENSWRSLNAPHLMKEVYDGQCFKDGVAVRPKTEPTRKTA